MVTPRISYCTRNECIGNAPWAARKKYKQLQAENKRLKEDKPKEPDVDLKTAIAQFSRIMHLFEIKNPKQGQLVEMKRRLNNLFWHLQALKDK